MHRSLLLACLAFGIFPHVAHASVTINEVAWMGTGNQYEEWFELYNEGSSAISLDGWSMYKVGGTKLITLSGSVTAGGYALVCRTTGTVTNPLGGVCTQTGAFGGSGMNNQSDQLVLKDAEGTIIDSIDATGGWPAGDVATKETMQKSGSGWITATGTPGEQNASVSPDSGADDDDDPADPSVDTDPDPPDSGGGRGGKAAKGVKVRQVDPNPVYTATLVTAPDHTLRGVPTRFEAKVSKDKPWIISLSGRYAWSMGDGSSYVFRKNTPVIHTYQHPGTYTVVFQYYSAWLKDKPDSIHMKEVTVLDDSVIIAKVAGTDDIRVMNRTDEELDMRGWILRSLRGDQYQFPPYTLVAEKSEIIVPNSIIAFPPGMDILLENPSGKHVSSTIPAAVTPRASSYGASRREQSHGNKSRPLDSIHPLEDIPDQILGDQVPVSKRPFPWPFTIGVFLAAVSGYAAYRYTGHSSEQAKAEEPSEYDDYDLEELLDEDE